MYNVNTKETEIVYGYSLADARERSPKYEQREWICLTSTYIDWGGNENENVWIEKYLDQRNVGQYDWDSRK